MHENDESCTFETVKEKISDELRDLFRYPTSGIQNAFELIFCLVKEQEERYKADHERLREENKMLIENMKSLQESNLSMLEAFKRKEVSSSKLEEVVGEIKQLVSGSEKMKMDQMESKELLKQLSENVKVLEFQLQMGTDGDDTPVTETIAHSCMVQREIGLLASETNAIQLDDTSNVSPSDTPQIVASDDIVLLKSDESIPVEVQDIDKHHFSIKHKFSHKSQSHRTLTGRLTILEAFKDEFKCDLDCLKADFKKMTETNKPNVQKIEESKQEESTNNDSVAASADIHSDSKINQRVLQKSAEIKSDMNSNNESDLDSNTETPIETNRNVVLTNVNHHDTYETAQEDCTVDGQEKRVDWTMLDILNRIETIEQKHRQLKEQCDSILDNFKVSRSDIGVNNMIDIDISSIYEKINSVQMNMVSMLTEDDLKSKMDEYMVKQGLSLTERMHAPADSVIQYQNQIETKLEILEKDKIDRVTFQEALSEKEVRLYNKVHDEINEQIHATVEKIISIKNEVDECRQNIVNLQLRPTAENRGSEVGLDLDDMIRHVKESIEAKIENNILHRLDGLKTIEDEMENVTSKLAEVPERNQINQMLQELEKSIMKHIGKDDTTKSIVDELRVELKDRMTKAQVLKTVKHLLSEAKNDIHSDETTSSSLMVGYKCLCCNDVHPTGIHRYVAQKINHNSLPCGKALCHSSILYGQPRLDCVRIRPSTTESSPRLPRLTKQEHRPSTASFLGIGSRRNRPQVTRTNEANRITL